MTKADLIARIDNVIAKGAAVLGSVPNYSPSELERRKITKDILWVQKDVASVFRTAGISVLQGLYGVEHQLYRDFDKFTDGANTLAQYKQAHALIVAVRELVDLGWLDDTRALIAADIFANILEMAEYLLSEGYKDAAAVLIGGSLEGHLRSLATRHKIDTRVINSSGDSKPKKAELLNQELHKADAYKLGDQKQVTAWLDLRNDAAHAHYAKYSKEQVLLMLQGVQNFIVRVPV